MANQEIISQGQFKELSEFQVNEPVTLELSCTYEKFIVWLKNYPEAKGESGKTIKLKFKELRQFEIAWYIALDTPGYKVIDWPLFDGFSFDVVQNDPLILSGFYSYLDLIKPREDVYSKQAKDFIDLLKRYFGKTDYKAV